MKRKSLPLRFQCRESTSLRKGCRASPSLAFWRTTAIVGLSAAIVVPAAPGCASRNPHGPAAPTQADRILQTYREIERGRLLILADFEDPNQMSLFSFEGVSKEGRFAFDAKKGRTETGTGCLLLTVGSAGDNIVIANKDASEWYLKRDWRPYDLLMLSVHSPNDDLALDVGIGSGTADQRSYAYSSTVLSRGWNVVRLDLAEVSEQIPLDDIREVRLSISGADKPLPIRFDDIVLAGNRVDLQGSSSNKAGALYVQQAGRHVNIGAGGRFEISFAKGQITHWYNLAADPHRLRNLVRATTLGPSPVVVDAEGRQLGDFSALGRTVSARQRVVELSAVRAVVEAEWRFIDEPGAALDRRPFQKWTYTIYPTGQIFVAVEATSQTDAWSPPGLGLAVTLASAAQEPVQTTIAGAVPAVQAGADPVNPKPETTPQPPAHARARIGAADATLLFIPYPRHPRPRIVELADPDHRRTSLIFVDDAPASPTRSWECQIVLSSGAAMDDAEAAARALDYATPAPARVDIGRVPSATDSKRRTDGFDPATGAFVLNVEQNRVRLTLDGRQRPLFAPAVEIAGGRGAQSWVYVDNLIFEPVLRRGVDWLVFQLPGEVRRSTLIEVLFRHEATSSPP